MLLIVKCPGKGYFENLHLKENMGPTSHLVIKWAFFFREKNNRFEKRRENEKSVYRFWLSHLLGMYVVDYLTEVPSHVVRKWMHVVGYLTEVPLGIICDKSTDSYSWIESGNPAEDDIWHFLTAEKFVQIQFCNKNVFLLIIPSGQIYNEQNIVFCSTHF